MLQYKRYLLNFIIYLFFLTFLTSFSKVNAELLITVIGDSLVSGYGLTEADSFTSVLENKLIDYKMNVNVNNAGVSGDTSAGGLARLDWVIADKPDILIIVLGSNDMLRGISPSFTEQNLSSIIQKSLDKRITVLLCGMKAGDNMGSVYKEKFDSLFISLKNKYQVFYYPFFLEGVALNSKYNQDDLMHPNKKGVEVIVKNIIPEVIKVINFINKK